MADKPGARELARRSQAAVEAKDRDAWLGLFAADAVVYDTPGAPRTWRYSDIQFISSAGPFQLTVTTLEKQFNFQLKRSITESTYNQLWLEIEKKNGRIQ